MTEKQILKLIKSLADYNSPEQWGRALRYVVKMIEQESEKKSSARKNRI